MDDIQFKYEGSNGITEEEMRGIFETLSAYRGELQNISKQMDYRVPESSLALSFDQEMHDGMKAFAAKFKNPSLKYIIHIGIGGSSLGTQAIYDALFGTLDPFFQERFPKIIFADTTNPDTINVIRHTMRFLKAPEEIVLSVVSKSGGTTETAANFEMIYGLLKERFGAVKERVAVITDHNSKLWVAAAAQGFGTFSIPQSVGGRFSVLSAAGLFSLFLAGVPIDEVRHGASLVLGHCLSDDLKENGAAVSAAITYAYYRKGVALHNSFFFDQNLESLGKWYRQLIGESLGKEYDAAGNRVSAGITPLISIGSNDLHSMVQLYLGGPKNMFTTFIRTTEKGIVDIPDTPVLPGIVEGIAGKSFNNIIEAIYEGVKVAYRKRTLPFAEIVISKISPRTLGAFMQFKMIETMYLARLMGLNAFDQPNVEEYKVETRKLLAGE